MRGSVLAVSWAVSALEGDATGPSEATPSSLTPDLSRATHAPPADLVEEIRARGALVNEKDGSILIPIPAGETIFGSPPGEGWDHERPQFPAALPTYFIGLHPVTNAQWVRFLEAKGARAPERWPAEASADHPVAGVCWYDAQAYCEWAGLRLPTELEWERAARGADCRRYPWGSPWDSARCQCSRAGYEDSGGTSGIWTHPSGRSPYGLYDMAGNVWELCSDWYDAEAYRRYANGDLTAPPRGERRVLRGGSWRYFGEGSFRCSERSSDSPSTRGRDYGFRVARDL